MSIETLPSFNPKYQVWEIYRHRVKLFLTLNDIQSEEANLSDDAYLLLRNLSHPKEVETLNFDKLVGAIANLHIASLELPCKGVFRFGSCTIQIVRARCKQTDIHKGAGSSRANCDRESDTGYGPCILATAAAIKEE